MNLEKQLTETNKLQKACKDFMVLSKLKIYNTNNYIKKSKNIYNINNNIFYINTLNYNKNNNIYYANPNLHTNLS